MASKKVMIKNFKSIDIDQYRVEVFYKDKDYGLNFNRNQWEDCFDYEKSFKKESKNHFDDLNHQHDFLEAIRLFLDSRIELGWEDCIYELDIRHIFTGRIIVGYNQDDKVYGVGNFQIVENISRRRLLGSISNSRESDFSLVFEHSLSQRNPVSFKVSHQVIEKIIGETWTDNVDSLKLIKHINEDFNIRLRFSKACDLISQKFKSKGLTEAITELNWSKFYSDPKGFVTSSFEIAA